jgi:hypothetical protein
VILRSSDRQCVRSRPRDRRDLDDLVGRWRNQPVLPRIVVDQVEVDEIAARHQRRKVGDSRDRDRGISRRNRSRKLREIEVDELRTIRHALPQHHAVE